MQCLKNELERKKMKSIPYVSIIGNLMYAQTCTLSDSSVLLLGCWADIKVIRKWITRKLQRKFLSIYKAPRFTCSHIEGRINLRWQAIRSQIISDVGTQKNPHLATRSFWEKEQFYGKVKNSMSLLLPLWRICLWHTLRPLFRYCA